MTRNADSIGTRTCRPARSQEYHGPRVVLVVVLAMVGGNDHGAAQTLWRGLVVAPEVRCAPYDADAYRYPRALVRERTAPARVNRSTRSASTRPFLFFGVDRRRPEMTARAAISASTASDFPRRRRSLRSGRSTSCVVTPAAFKKRMIPAP